MRAALVVFLLSAGCAPSLGGDFTPGDFISDNRFTELVLEIDAVRGRNADDDVYARLRGGLDRLADEDALHKPEGVTFAFDDDDEDPIGDADTVHTIEELNAFHDEVIDLDVDDDDAVMHVFWVDGRYEGDDGDSLVLGFSYRGDRILMLSDNIRRACDGGVFTPIERQLCERTTSTVLLHEMGHLFGLVNNGAPMQVDHQDEDNGAHDDNPDCLMFFGVETSALSNLIADRLARSDEDIFFDENCLDDLRALD
ncbi:MAG: hypothetical protein Q8O67_10000 [Deltaproteobacteria bacterium]|nr:hypothetical protein [Deltaproteobacteria bacterium]